MPTRTKIKIKDNNELRAEIDALYEKADQVCLAKWSLAMAKRILDITNTDYHAIHVISQGFATNELWQAGKASMHNVRQAGFLVHQIARDCDNEIRKASLRAAGQAIGSGHMREHAMVASDYAIKAIGLLSSDDIADITAERTWQLNELKKLMQLTP